AVFDGASGVKLPNGLISSYKYSISLWLKPDRITQYTTSFFGARSTDDWISLLPGGYAGNQTGLWSRAYTANGEKWFDGMVCSRIPTNTWSHLAVTVNEGLVKVYLNGERKFSGAGLEDIFTTEDAVFSLAVNYWDVPYKGLMDELLIYDGIVLSSNEIKTYFETGEFPTELNQGRTELQELLANAKVIK